MSDTTGTQIPAAKSTTATRASRRPASGGRVLNALRNLLAGLGLVLSGAIVGGFAADVGSFDRTRGGYEAPYTGWTGTPIDWSTVDVTPTGMAKRGHVSNSLIDCTTGMISFQIFGLEVPFRKLSDRALVVHRPREACAARGFAPAF